jgi:hypothetical protein
LRAGFVAFGAVSLGLRQPSAQAFTLRDAEGLAKHLLVAGLTFDLPEKEVARGRLPEPLGGGLAADAANI